MLDRINKYGYFIEIEHKRGFLCWHREHALDGCASFEVDVAKERIRLDNGVVLEYGKDLACHNSL